MQQYVKTLSLLAALALTACGKDDDSSTESATTAAVTVTDAVEAFEFLDNAVGTAAPGALAIVTGLKLEDVVSADNAACSANGDAWDSTTERSMDFSKEKAAAQTFYCKISLDSGSPETPRGAYGIGKGIICALNNAVDGGIVYADGDGTKATVAAKIDKACFNEGVYNDSGETPNGFDADLSYKAVNLDVDATGWDKKITLYGEPATTEGEESNYLFRFSDGVVAVANEQWSIAIDVGAGELRFEMANTSMGGGGGDKLVEGASPFESQFHLRLYAKGTLDADTGAITEHSVIQGLMLSAKGLASVKGTKADGYATHSWGTDTGGLETEVASYCVGATTCGAGFGTTLSAYDDFVDSEKWSTDLTAIEPLSFTEVTTAGAP